MLREQRLPTVIKLLFFEGSGYCAVFERSSENIVRINGKRSIGLSIYKEMRFNTVKVVDEVTRQLAVIENALPGYHFQVISNQGTFIKVR